MPPQSRKMGELVWKKSFQWQMCAALPTAITGFAQSRFKESLFPFFGLGGSEMYDEETETGRFYAGKGILYLIPYQNSWAWMNRQTVDFTDELIDALMREYSL